MVVRKPAASKPPGKAAAKNAAGKAALAAFATANATVFGAEAIAVAPPKPKPKAKSAGRQLAKDADSVSGQRPWPAAAVPVENPYCSCALPPPFCQRLTPLLVVLLQVRVTTRPGFPLLSPPCLSPPARPSEDSRPLSACSCSRDYPSGSHL